MGLIDKFKNLFTEEIEEEVHPIKKEVRHVEIPSPKRSETPKVAEVNSISDSTAITKEEKVIAPVYFDDKDFDDLEKPRETIKEKPVIRRENPSKLYGGKKIEEKKVEPLTFKPSPIISPVYGVLDKNYTKKEITSNKNEIPKRRNNEKLTIDDIRNKAYGTLEDELKDTFFDDDYMYEEGHSGHNKYDDEGAIDVLEELNLDEIDNYDEIKKTDDKVNKLILDDLDLDDDTELLAKQLEEQNRKLEEINQMIDEEEISSRQEKEIDLLSDKEEEQTRNAENIESIIDEQMENTVDEVSDDVDEEEVKEENEVKEVSEDEKPKDETPKKETKKRKEQKDMDDSLTESELLDLVDSMYDEKGE